MLGMFDHHIQGIDTEDYYRKLAEKMKTCAKTSPAFTELFRFYEELALVLSKKMDLGIRIKEAYDKKDKQDSSADMQPGYSIYHCSSSRDEAFAGAVVDAGCETLSAMSYWILNWEEYSRDWRVTGEGSNHTSPVPFPVWRSWNRRGCRILL